MSRVCFFAIILSMFIGEPCHASKPYTLERLQKELASDDVAVRKAAIGDVINHNYRSLTAKQLVPLIQPFLSKDMSKHGVDKQGLLMMHLGQRFGTEADAISPLLLRYMVDDGIRSYLRGRAIESAFLVTQDRKKLVDTLIQVVKNPKPSTTTGVHDVAATALGKMGSVAIPARPSIEKLLDHHYRMTRYAAHIAVGQLQLAEHPLDDASALSILKKQSRLDDPETTAATLYFRKGIKLPSRGEPVKPINDAARQAQKHLIHIIASSQSEESKRVALGTLRYIGTPTDPSSVETIVDVLINQDLRAAILLLETLQAKDKRSVAPLRKGLQQTLKEGDFEKLHVLADALARFGKEAINVSEDLSKAVRSLKGITVRNDMTDWQLRLYLETLQAIGAKQQIQSLALDLLPEKSPLVAASGKHAWIPQSRLLQALSTAGLPDAPKQRDKFYELFVSVIKKKNNESTRQAAHTLSKHGDKLNPAQREQLGRLLYDRLRVTPENAVNAFGDTRSFTELNMHVAILLALHQMGTPSGDIKKIRQVAALPMAEPSYRSNSHEFRKQIEAARKIVEQRDK